MNEIEFHKTSIRMLSRVIENRNAEAEYLKFILKHGINIRADFVDTLLDAINDLEYLHNSYSQQYLESEKFLDSKGIEEVPYRYTPPETIHIQPHSFLRKFFGDK